MRDEIQGVQVSAPFGNVKYALEVFQALPEFVEAISGIVQVIGFSGLTWNLSICSDKRPFRRRSCKARLWLRNSFGATFKQVLRQHCQIRELSDLDRSFNLLFKIRVSRVVGVSADRFLDRDPLVRKPTAAG